jgi:hypothetical protein
VNCKLGADKRYASLLKNIQQGNNRKHRILIKTHTLRMYTTILPVKHGFLLSGKNIKYKCLKTNCLRKCLHLRRIN